MNPENEGFGDTQTLDPRTKRQRILDILHARPGQYVKYKVIAEEMGDATASQVQSNVQGILKSPNAQEYHLQRGVGSVMYDPTRPGEVYTPRSQGRGRSSEGNDGEAAEVTDDQVVRSLRAVHVELKGGERLVRDSTGRLYRLTPVN